MCTQLINKAIVFKPDLIGVESNLFQALIIRELDRAVSDRKLPITNFPFIPVENLDNKKLRIRRLSSPISMNKIKYKSRSSGVSLLIEQLSGFPDDGVHDDGPDALEGAVRISRQLTQFVGVPNIDRYLGDTVEFPQVDM